MRIPINWNAVTAVCAIVVAVFTASGWLTDGLREDIRDLRQEMREEFAEMRQEMREGFAETREDIEVLQQDVAFIKGRTLPDQTTNGNTQRSDSGKQVNMNPE
ncbi:MAG: hypothetical protein OXD39_06725 [Gemmatimonadetes bacterium]|nr:hypothetical protein [Gemmatimonadota bacterium]